MAGYRPLAGLAFPVTLWKSAVEQTPHLLSPQCLAKGFLETTEAMVGGSWELEATEA